MEERRRYPRTLYEDTVMFKLYWVEGHPELSGKAMMGTIQDVSITGVRFLCSEQLKPDVRLSLCVVMSEPHGFFPMRGMVKRAGRASESEDWMVGIEFEANEHELEGWTAFIHDVERRAQAAEE